jgi:hypothetical protein
MMTGQTIDMELSRLVRRPTPANFGAKEIVFLTKTDVAHLTALRRPDATTNSGAPEALSPATDRRLFTEVERSGKQPSIPLRLTIAVPVLDIETHGR